jgi:hypothetical protein
MNKYYIHLLLILSLSSSAYAVSFGVTFRPVDFLYSPYNKELNLSPVPRIGALYLFTNFSVISIEPMIQSGLSGLSGTLMFFDGHRDHFGIGSTISIFNINDNTYSTEGCFRLQLMSRRTGGLLMGFDTLIGMRIFRNEKDHRESNYKTSRFIIKFGVDIGLSFMDNDS